MRLSAALLALLLTLTPRALAQALDPAPEPPVGMVSMYQTMLGGGYHLAMSEAATPVMTSRDVPAAAAVLGLDQQQQDSALALQVAHQVAVDDHRRALLEQWRELRAKMQREDPAKFNGLAAMRDTFLASRARKTEIDAEFLRDLRSILRPEQEANWDGFERTIRRENRLRFAYLSGERADLVAIVRALDLQSPELGRVLGAYEEELDRAILQREKVRESTLDRSRGMKYDGSEQDGDLIKGLLEEVRAAGIRVRDVNRKYTRQILEILPPQHAASFESAVAAASYPEVYRPTLAHRALAAAAEFDDLSAPQREDIGALASRFEKEIRPLDEELVRATQEAEEKFKPADTSGDPFGVAALKKKREAMVKGAYEQLQGLLSPQQRERLPQPAPR